MAKAKEKPGVMLYWSMFDVLESLLDGQTKTMLHAIRNYSQYGEVPNFGSDTTLTTLWLLVKPQIDADTERYERVREQRRLAGLASAEKRATETNGCQHPSTAAHGCQHNQPITDSIPATVSDTLSAPIASSKEGIRDNGERHKGLSLDSPPQLSPEDERDFEERRQEALNKLQSYIKNEIRTI